MSTDDSVPHFCVQKFPPAELAQEAIQNAVDENPENIIHSSGLFAPPAGGIPPAQGTDYKEAPRLGLFVRKMWKKGRTLRVLFLSGGGSEYVRGKVKQYANVWSEYANIHFQFVESGPSDIRITFDRHNGSWSFLGTDSKLYPGLPTMNFGWFSDKTPDEEFSRTVTHEFGHAIGCVHEHQQPKSKFKWNKQFVYDVHRVNYNWTEAQVNFNILDRYSDEEVTATEWDATSIMEYPIPKEFTTNGYSSGFNNHLSPTDISFIKKMYPKDTVQPAVAASNLEIGVFNTMSNLSHGAKAMNYRTVVNFSKRYLSSPAFIVGLNFLDFDNSRNFRIRSLVEAVIPSQAVLSLRSWDDIEYASGVSWFLFPSENEDFQRGTLTTKDANAANTINFDHEYLSPPKVLVFFTTLDIENSADCHVKTYALEVTTCSFKLCVESGSNTKLSEAGISWIAHPADKQGIATGTFSTEDVRSSGTPQPNTQGTAVFRPAFAKPPKIFLALNMLNLDRGTQARVRLSNSSVLADKMEWHIDSWGDTSLNAAAATYIAISG